ncbi:unnamed protein product [Eruca vesicaria subsp. sativa]|uniref:CRIB domain-containing protein n=1 Tax=Eruca vesicaria subsp. sativa TaxID=29727 RepID=A0ABC8LVT6_ERUVS|nr:unnamed protein product [Eruca vesicaria subsp. sativa]
MASSSMKSLLKGLRYISQVFEIGKEEEEEEEIEIGNPTDVKHVAHIGWDGPSATPASAPSWMNDFKTGGGIDSGQGGGEDDSSAKCMSECGDRTRDLPKLPKSTRKAASEKGSPTREISSSDKTKRRSSKKGTSSSSRRPKEVSELNEFSSWSSPSVGTSPEVPRKSRRKKKTKETGGGGSARSIRRSDVDNVSETGSVRSMPQFDNRDDF